MKKTFFSDFINNQQLLNKILIVALLLPLALSGCLTFEIPQEPQPTIVVFETAIPEIQEQPTQYIPPVIIPTLTPTPWEQISVQPTMSLFPTDKPIPTDVPLYIEPTSQPGLFPSVPTHPQFPLQPTFVEINGLGYRVDRNGLALTAVHAQWLPNFDDLVPAEGNVFLLIYVRIENTGTPVPMPFDPILFTLRDANGVEYGLTTTTPYPQLLTGVLNVGEQTEGYIAYEVPEGTTGLILNTENLSNMGFALIKIQIIN